MFFRFDTQARVGTQHTKSEWQVDVWCDKTVSMLSIKEEPRERENERKWGKVYLLCRWCVRMSCTLNLMRLLISNLSVIRKAKWLCVRVSLLMSIDDVDSSLFILIITLFYGWVSEWEISSFSPPFFAKRISLNHLQQQLNTSAKQTFL